MKLFHIYFFILLVFCVVGCTDFDTENDEVSVNQEYPDQESWNARMYFTRDGQRRAVLTAGYIAKYSAKKVTLLKEGVKVEFYDQAGDLKSVLNSDEGKVYDNKEDMVASGNVVIRSKNGNYLYTEELFWKNSEQKIVSNVQVKITTPNDTLYGDNLVSDPELIEYEITNARGTSKSTISVNE